jgi:hypothetical protein
VWTNPFLFSRADSTMYGASSDPGLTRAQVLDRYYDHCERVMQEDRDGDGREHVFGPATVTGMGEGEGAGGVKIGKLLDAAKNVFHACPGAGRYRQRLMGLHAAEGRRRRAVADGFVQSGEEGGLDPALIVSAVTR